MLRDCLYDFKYVSDDKESYFTYSVKDDSVVLRFMLDASGLYGWMKEKSGHNSLLCQELSVKCMLSVGLSRAVMRIQCHSAIV